MAGIVKCIIAQDYLLYQGSLKTARIFLASPGGDLAEAMKIGRLIRQLKIATVVPDRMLNNADLREQISLKHGVKDFKSNYVCASACFFVFVAGIDRTSDGVGTDPILGIHRPYLSQDDLLSLSGDQAIAARSQTRSIVENYLREMGVSAKYADQMFSVSKDSIRWISNDDFETDLKGFIPELKDWIDARCNKLSDDEKKIWQEAENIPGSQQRTAHKVATEQILKKRFKQIDCEHDLQFDMYVAAWVTWSHRQDQVPQPHTPFDGWEVTGPPVVRSGP